MSWHRLPCRKRFLCKLLLSITVLLVMVTTLYDRHTAANTHHKPHTPSHSHQKPPAVVHLLDRRDDEDLIQAHNKHGQKINTIGSKRLVVQNYQQEQRNQEQRWDDQRRILGGVYEDERLDDEIQISPELRNELWPTRPPLLRSFNGQRNHIARVTTDEPGTNRIYIDSIGQIGSQMFEYASFYGISRAVNKEPYLSYRSVLPSLFKNITVARGYDPKVRIFIEDYPGVYTTSLFRQHRGDISVCCYLQSWRYFYSYEEELRKQLIFNDEIERSADKVLKELLVKFLQELHDREKQSVKEEESMLNDLPADNNVNSKRRQLSDYLPSRQHGSGVPVLLNGTQYRITLIGVHVHRLGYAHKNRMAKGFHPAPSEYIQQAMDYMRIRHPVTNLLFVVVSDDSHWCKTNITDKHGHGDIVFSGYNAASVDLALLKRMEHMVITTGAFGWWGGWLAGGDVVYYPDWIQPDKQTGKSYKMSDHYPPWWIPISLNDNKQEENT